jgi:hypothetical protein
MKKIIISAILFATIAFTITSCSKSSSTDNTGGGGGTTCAGVTSKFASDVQPIFASSCAVSSGCHGTGSTNSGGPFTNYTLIEAKKAAIKAAVQNGSMPKSGSLSQAQKNAIICWVDAGALNN